MQRQLVRHWCHGCSLTTWLQPTGLRFAPNILNPEIHLNEIILRGLLNDTISICTYGFPWYDEFGRIRNVVVVA
jgi:hypothetical protein